MFWPYPPPSMLLYSQFQLVNLLNGSKERGIICIRVVAVDTALGELSGAAFQSTGPAESRSRVVGAVNVVMVVS